MLGLQKIFSKRAIDRWREEQVLGAAIALNQLAADLAGAFEEDIAATKFRNAVLNQHQFLVEKVAPHVRLVADIVIKNLVDAANEDLLRITQYSVIWHDMPSDRLNESARFDGWSDVAGAGTSIAAGASVVSALPAMSVATTTAWFGLITTTTISWPIVIVGGSIAGFALATGVFKASQVRPKADVRMRRKIHDYVVKALIKGTPSAPAILEQLSQAYLDTANRAKALL